MKKFAAPLGVLALSFSPLAAMAATYTVNTTTQQETAITSARNVYNAGLPGGASNPGFAATNSAFMLQQITASITNWNRQTNLVPVLTTSDAANATTLLNACVSANGLGGLTSAQCQSLLTDVQTAPTQP